MGAGGAMTSLIKIGAGALTLGGANTFTGGVTLNDGGLDAVLAHVRALVTERGPAVMVIDSFKALSAYAATPQVFRHFLHELAGMLTAFPTTAFWIGEYGRDEIATAPEFAAELGSPGATGVVRLGN